MKPGYQKYIPYQPISLPDRTWPDRVIEKAPVWCSVDLRDGNQALINPMSLEDKLAFFEILVKIGFKEIEVGFPAASETEYEFLRRLIDENLIPDDVTVQVLTQAREHIIKRTFEAVKGAPQAIIHLYNSTSRAQREQVFKKDKAEEIRSIILDMVRKAREALEEENEQEASLGEGVDAPHVAASSTEAVVASTESPASEAVLDEQTIKDAFFEDDFDVTYSAKEFLINAITSTSIIVFLLIIGGLMVIGAGVIIAASNGIGAIAAAAGGFIVAAFTIISIIWAQVKSWESDINFRSTRRDQSILINTGLITRRKYTIPLAKINAIEINSTFLGVLSKRARVDVVNIGGDSNDTTGHRILLYDKVPELMRKLKLLIPQFKTIDRISYERQPLNVLVRGLIGCTLWFGIICGGAAYAMNMMWGDMGGYAKIPYFSMLVVYLITMLGFIMSFRRKGLYYDDLYLVVVSGVFSRSIKVIPYERIQQIEYRDNPIFRLFNVKSAAITVQGGSMGMSVIGTGQFQVSRYESVEEHLRKTY